MKRRPLSTFAGRTAAVLWLALSLVLCVGVGVLWLAALHVPLAEFHQIEHYHKSDVGPRIVREDHLWANPRQVEGFFRRDADATKSFDYDFSTLKIPGAYVHWSGRNGRYFEFHFDYWFLLLVGGALPLMKLTGAARRAIRRRRLRASPGHVCLSCGYDLRATPQRCPECGTIAAPRRAI